MLRLVPLVLLGVALAGSCARAPHCDRLLVGGTVHLAAGPRRAEVAITSGRIVAVIAPEAAASWRRAATEVVDLTGAHLYPGFTESHGHLVGYGAALEQVDLEGTASFAEVVARTAAAARLLPPGSWVRGRGWDQNRWPGQAFPMDEALSAALPDNPVLLRRVDGHAVITNGRGLLAAGITAATPDPPGGRILRNARGEPTGVFVDTAAELLERAEPHPTGADIERQTVTAAKHLAAFGITEIHDAGTGRDELEVLRRLVAERRLGVRVYAMLNGSDDALLATELAIGPRTSPDGMLSVRAVKLYADGALGSRGAWLSAPYSDDPTTSGLEVTSEARLADVVRRAAAASFQPCIHAIGDAAVTRVLDFYERELAGAGRTLRPRVEHAQIVRPEDVPRFAALGVIASVQPTHCTSDMPWAPRRLGDARIAWAYRWRSLQQAGARLCLGSDVPVESPDPRLGMWAAVTRRPIEPPSAAAWSPAEALSVPDAIAGYTAWAAYAGFEEAWRGAIMPTFAADITVLDRALEDADPAVILQVRVVRTIVAGRDVFVAGGPT